MMGHAKLSCCVLSGLVLVADLAHAQEANDRNAVIRLAADVSAEQTEPLSRQKLLADANSLIKSGRAAEAYALLVPEQSRLAGDAEYDYLLGIAALDSGKPNEAIFALERVLAVNPGHVQARAEIARAYFATGEKVLARKEFEAVQRQNPPGEVSATIQRFLDAIDQGQGKGTALGGYLDVSIGSDSNVNSATSGNQVAIPAFGGAIATLDANGVEQKDSFANVGGGVNVRHALSPDWSAFGSASFSQRLNSAKRAFNTGSINGNAGLGLTSGKDKYSAALQLQTFSVDNQRYRDGAGMTLQWQRDLSNKDSQFSTYFQFTDLKYPGQSLRDARRYVLGAAYAGMLDVDYKPAVFAGLYAGLEKEKGTGVPYLGHKFYGVRAGGEMTVHAQTRLFGSVSVESRNHGGEDPFFLVTRKDTQADLKVGVNYTMAKLWTLTPQFSYTRNKSNIVINDYKRSVVSIGLRRDFN